MRQQGRWRRLGVVSLAVLGLATGQGCLSFVHSLDAPPQEQVALGEKIPSPCRSHVHIFLLHGLDPLDLANLSGLTEYLQQEGYLKTHYGQCYHLWAFKKEMRRLHKEDPQTRFVVIGFSLGATAARQLVAAVKKDGIIVDLLVYLSGCTLGEEPPAPPDNVLHVVNVVAAGCLWNASMDGADNVSCSQAWHFGAPTHPRTRELLSRELAAVAARVPYTEKVPPLSPELEEEIPRPRRLTPELPGKMSAPLPPEWSFLNPRSAAGEPPPPPLAQPDEKRKTPRIPFAIAP